MTMQINETNENVLYVDYDEKLYITNINRFYNIFHGYKLLRNLNKNRKYEWNYKGIVFIYITKQDGSKVEESFFAENFNFVNYDSKKTSLIYFNELIEKNKGDFSSGYLFKDAQIIDKKYYPLKLSFYKYENNEYVPIPFKKYIRVEKADTTEKEKDLSITSRIKYVNNLPPVANNISFSSDYYKYRTFLETDLYCVPKDNSFDLFNYITFSDDSIYTHIDENIFKVFVYSSEINKYFRVTLDDTLKCWQVVEEDEENNNFGIKENYLNNESTKYKIIYNNCAYYQDPTNYSIYNYTIDSDTFSILNNLSEAVSALERLFVSVKLRFINSTAYIEPTKRAFTIILKDLILHDNKKGSMYKVPMYTITYMIVNDSEEE